MEETNKKTAESGKTETTNKTEPINKKYKDIIGILIGAMALIALLFIFSAVKAASAKKEAFILKSDLKQFQQDFQLKEDGFKAQIDEITAFRDELEKKAAELSETNKKYEIRVTEADKYIQVLKEDLQNQRKEVLSEVNEFISANKMAEQGILEKVNELSKINEILQQTVNELSRLAKVKPAQLKEIEDTIALGRIVVPSEQKNEQAEAASYYSGKVMNVNTRYNFVVIDLGQECGVKEGVELPVFRSKKKIGDIIIKEAYTHMCLATVIQEKTASEIRKGDEVRFTPRS